MLSLHICVIYRAFREDYPLAVEGDSPPEQKPVLCCFTYKLKQLFKIMRLKICVVLVFTSLTNKTDL